MRFRLAILVAVVLFFGAVITLFLTGYLSGGGTAGVAGTEPLDADEFVAAYVELAKLAETTPIGTPEYQKARERVLGHIGVTPAQVEETLTYYNSRPDLWRPIWEKIQTQLADDLKKFQEQPITDSVTVESSA